MIITITTLELKFLEETLETILDEMEGFEECAHAEDYVFTTGAVDMCRESLVMLRRMSQEVEREDTSIDS